MQNTTPLELINKALNQQISDSEQELLSIWLNENDANIELFEEMRKIWRSSSSYQPGIQFDASSAFEKFKHTHITSDPHPNKEMVHHQRKKNIPLWPSSFILRIAAIGVLCIMAFFTWRQFIYNPVITHSNIQGSVVEYQLPDGSAIWLNGESILSHKKKFTGEQRVVNFSGIGYFEIAKIPGKPFSVLMENDIVQVLGTSFQIKEDAELGIQVSVDEGHVRIKHLENAKEIDLTTGNRATFDNNKQDFNVEKVLTPNHAAWKNNGLSFISTPLPLAIADIEEYYHIEIIFDSEKIQFMKWNSPNLGDASLDNVLATLESNFPIHFDKLGKDSFDLKVK